MSQLIQLESERLIYYPMDIRFANETYLSWLNDVEVNKYLEIPKTNYLNDLIDYVNSTVKAGIFFWAIVKKSDNKHIGNIKIDPISTKHGYGEYGILMGERSEWGKGYAKEASKTILEYCFNQLNLRKVNLGVIAENIPAINLYKTLGFNIEGHYKHHVKFENHFSDVFRMAIFNKSINYN